jgi:hypothetical protein
LKSRVSDEADEGALQRIKNLLSANQAE